MALYWPEQKVALDIVDDPYRNPFEGDESYTVLRVTCADLRNYDSYRKIMSRLCELLGAEVPSMPGWEQKHRELHSLLYQNLESELLEACSSYDLVDDDLPSELEILAGSEEEGELMSEMAREDGCHVRGVSIWDGPVPSGSFEDLTDTVRMSTPEYFFLRKANQLPFAQAVCLGVELCGKYRTSLTQQSRDEGYDFIKTPRSSKAMLRHYLQEIRNTKEGKRAKRVLRYVVDECNSPMSCFLYLTLCLPRNRGSYALGRAQPSAAFRTEDGFMPSSSGDFLAYDLCWPKKLVALQYVGSEPVSIKNYHGLETQGMRVVCMTDKDIADPDRFDRLARKVADLLDIKVPEPSKEWLDARDKLRRQLEVPTYDHMLLTLSDITKHKDW